ncbi:MAG: hypothetical protein ABW133_22585, partial [Polyangiaceae bacterium]
MTTNRVTFGCVAALLLVSGLAGVSAAAPKKGGKRRDAAADPAAQGAQGGANAASGNANAASGSATGANGVNANGAAPAASAA